MASSLKYQRLVNIHNAKLERYIDVSECNIYHYTSTSACNEILSHRTLRFTDRNYLNDYSEGRHVIELCIKSEFENLLPNEYSEYFKNRLQAFYDNPSKKQRLIFQCSFSLDNDNLSLWNYYTKSAGIQGYNLGFNSTELSHNLNTYNESKHHKLTVFHGKIQYNTEQQKAIVEQIISDFIGIIKEYQSDAKFCKLAIDLMIEKILFVGSFFKKCCFSHENEYRLLIHLAPYWDPESKQIKFMVIHKGANTYEKNGLFVPYLDIEFEKNDLKTISVSPTMNFDETESNIRNVLNIHGFNKDLVQIVKSDIPVRY